MLVDTLTVDDDSATRTPSTDVAELHRSAANPCCIFSQEDDEEEDADSDADEN